jgi:subtilisin family serine protease
MPRSIRRAPLALAGVLALLAALLAAPAGAVVPSGPLADGAGLGSASPLNAPGLFPGSLPAPADDRLVAANRSDVIPGHYIVVFEDSVKHPRSLGRAQAKQRGGRLGFVYPVLNGYSVKNLSRADVEALRHDPRVKYVSPSHRYEVAEQTTPTGIDRAFVTANEGVEIDEADNFRVDADVAVLDTGIDPEHPDLRVVSQAECTLSGVGECRQGGGLDGRGHGTHVAGTIAAMDNGEGVVGVAPGARLWAVKVLTDNGWSSDPRIVAGIEWVTAHADEIEVANMSIQGPDSQPMKDAIAASAEAGVVYAVAASNFDKDAEKNSPANSPDAITVSAVADYDGKPGGEAEPLAQDCKGIDGSGENNKGLDDTRASFSNYGEVVDVAAPGVCILSTFPTTPFSLESRETSKGYGLNSGTSMASPHVAGAAALLASEDNPEDLEDVEAIRNAIVEAGNTDDIEEGGWEDNSGDGVKEPLLDVSDEAVFAPADQSIVTGDAETLSTSEVTLHGEVDPGGLETEYWFEYGTTTEYGSKAPASGSSAGSGGEYASVEETVEGLEGQTLYHYRLVAANEEVTSYGLDRVFGTTPPTVAAQSATEINANDAELNATVNPEGLTTTYYFEYGPTNSYGRSTSLSDLEAGSEALAVTPELIDALDGKATYHFRVVATNIAGTTSGEDQTFMTEPADWYVQATPKPHPEAEEEEGVTEVERALDTVSCASATECVAVGATRVNYEDSSTVSYHEALHWDGQSWTEAELPMPEGVGSANVRIGGISCPSTGSCFALGMGPGASGNEAFVEHWDGEQWSAQILPPGEEEAEIKEPVGISCASADSCMAIMLYPASTIDSTAIYIWDGEEWSHIAEKPTLPEGSKPPLAPPSCPAPETCTLIGENPDGGWSAAWDGESWQAEEIPPLTEFSEGEKIIWDGVSCTSQSACVAVGQRADTLTWEPLTGYAPTQTASAVWDGEGWTAVSTAEPATSNDFQSFPAEPVSCKAADDCVLVTSIRLDGYRRTLTEHWDGEQWSRLSGANPLWPNTSPLAVSCTQGNCTAVGSGLIPGYGGDGMFVARLRPDEPHFEADEYPATISGEQDPEAKHTFDFQNASSVTCEQATLSGEASGHSTTLSLAPSYSECNWSVTENGCSYLLDAGNAFFGGEYAGSVDIVCPEGKEIVIRGQFGICEVQIPAQSDLEAITYTNPESNPQQVEATFALTGLEYTEVDTAFCEFTETATRNDGEYSGGTTVGAENAAEEAIGITVEGEAAEHDPRFEADEYPATISGEQDPEAKHTFDFLNAESVSCEQATLSGEASGHSTTLSLAPSYSECNWSVTENGCSYLLDAGNAFFGGEYAGSVDIVCPEGKQIVIKGQFGLCEVHVPPQSDLEAITYTNPESNPQQVEATFALTGLEYTEVDTAFCPFTETATRNDGKLVGGTTINAENTAEEAIGLRVDGG